MKRRFMSALHFGIGLFLLSLPSASFAQSRSFQTSTGESRSLSLSLNKSAVIEFDTDIDDVIIANPEIADIAMRGPRRVAVMGLDHGESNIVFLDRKGHSVLNLEVTVSGEGLAGLRRVLRQYVPDSELQVENVNGKVLLSGKARSAVSLQRAVMLAESYVDNKDDVLNMVSVMGKDQVLLKVRIVEMQRSVIKQLGVNLTANIAGSTVPQNVVGGDDVNWGLLSSTSNGFPVNSAISSGLNLAGGAFDLVGNYFGGSLQALERVGLVKTLAEPNLTAISGESAQFLAGGEFPVPQSESDGAVSVSYKEFGVALSFTPLVLSEGRISLKVSTEISETTSIGAVNISGSSSDRILVVPGLQVRRAQTTVEIPSGGSLVMAGLIQERSEQAVEGTPWLKDIPVIGALFRSRDFVNEESEMVVMITPYLVEPTDPGNLKSPTSGFRPASDLRSIFLGKLNQVYSVGGRDSGSDSPADLISGPVGFVIE